jgi:SAM-dependent methyltransferase
MNGDMKENVTRRGIWLRLCFMIILTMAFSLAEIILFAVVAFQFLSSLLTARTNDQLIRFGRNMARYLQQITTYLTFASEEIPFPFMPWPDEPDQDTPVDEDSDLPNEAPEDDATEDDETADAVMAEAPVEEDSAPLNEAPETRGDAIAEDEADGTKVAEAPAEEASHQQNVQPEIAPDAAEEDRAGDTKVAAATQTAVFADGNAYQKFMGERSRLGGEAFVKLLDPPSRLSWLDVGCGTGAFSAVILENCDPSALIGIDSSEAQIAHAQAELGNAQASFRVGDAITLPFEADTFDVAVSSYVLNFVPDKQKMMDEMARVVRPEGTVAISVFDVAGGRQSSHRVWELIGRNDPAFRNAEFERRGWDITHPEALSGFFENAGLEDVTVESIEIDETFANFDDYWASMTSMPTSGVGIYVNSLDENALQRFKDELKSLAPIHPDGSIRATSGSWVVRGKVPA